MQEGKKRTFWGWVRLITFTIIGTIPALFVISAIGTWMDRDMYSKAFLMQHLSNAREIYTGMQVAMLDAATTGKASDNSTSIYPADIGVKTNLEYITWLVKHGYFKESELSIFCKPGVKVQRLQDLKREDIAFCFANLSEKDTHDGNTIWIVSRNVVEGPLPPPPTPSRKW